MKLARLHDGTRLDLAHCCYGHPGTRGELLLGQARLLTESAQLRCQDLGLFAVATGSASSASTTSLQTWARCALSPSAKS